MCEVWQCVPKGEKYIIFFETVVKFVHIQIQITEKKDRRVINKVGREKKKVLK